MMSKKIKRLTDAQVQRFIMDGLLVLSLDDLGEDFHAKVYRMANARTPRGALSDDIDRQMPELRTVLECPTVRGALQGILGHGYIRHPHSAAYIEDVDTQESPANVEQGWHRDSYWGVQRMRHHRPRWLICMYYPAAVSLEMGPTAIAPGSQYYSLPGDGDASARPPAKPIRHDELDDPERIMQGEDLAVRDRLLRATIESLDPGLTERPMVVKAGSFCCFHYDLYHRRLRRSGVSGRTVPQRVMFKFLFTAGRVRTEPSWAHIDNDFAWANGKGSPSHHAVWESIWTFMLGSTTTSPATHRDQPSAADPSTASLTDMLATSEREFERMGAAYQLGEAGRAEKVGKLIEALQRGGDSTQRAAMHGLAVAGASAVDPLLTVLAQSDVDHHVACCVVHALGEAVQSPTVDMVNSIALLMDRVAHGIDVETRVAGGWPVGGGGHPPSSGFPNKSPNPKERQAWPPKLLHASCLQTLGLMGQRAVSAENTAVVDAIAEQCVACITKGEPGGGNPDYPPDSGLGSGFMSRQNAALGLRKLCGRGVLMSDRVRQEVIGACSRTVTDYD